MVYSTVTVTSRKGLAYVFVLVSVISQRVFWLAVMVGVEGEDGSDDTAAAAVLGLDWVAGVVDDGDVADATVEGAFDVVDLPMAVVDVDVEDVASAVVAD